MIKRRFVISLLAVVWLSIATVLAVPAWPGVTQVRQPDGSVLSICLHGDEYMHYYTTADGYTIMKSADGSFVYAEMHDGELVATPIVAHDAGQRTDNELSWLQTVEKHLKPKMSEENARLKVIEAESRQQVLARRRAKAARRAPRIDTEKFRGLILLVEFNDCPFSRSDYQEVIDAMVNQRNYTGYDDTPYGQYTGSVRDYFYDNSNHLFDPEFDVVGPIPVDYSQHDAHGKTGGADLFKIIQAAVKDAELFVPFNNYDNDGDGKVDLVFFIFSGISAHYGANDKDLVWPRAGYLSNYGEIVSNGVQIDRYACSTELYGSKENNMLEGIGTICHEFSHVLGLPDMYDVDEKNGQSNDPSSWSLMASGNSLNNGRTPAGYSLYDRYSLGFATPQTITEKGTYQLFPVGESNTGYRLNTKVDNEFFLLEYRHPIYKWDKYLQGHGMLVFRVDSTNVTPWTNSKINDDPEHNYYELVRAGGGKGATSSDPFPGSAGVTMLGNSTEPANLLTWSGEKSPFELVKIAEYGSVIAFDVVESEQGKDPDENDEPGQSGYGLKYWFDDQKELAGRIENFNAVFGLDVSTLSDGVHALHVAVYDYDSDAYLETGAQTVYFVKEPVMSSGRRADYTYYVDSVKLGSTLEGMDDIHEVSLPMKDIEEGLHRLTTYIKTPGETQTTVISHYFMRVATAKDTGNLRMTCSIDGAVSTTLQRGFMGDSLNYELDVSGLSPGLHRLTYQLTSTSGMLNTPPTTTFFLVDPQLKSYEYWLNGDRSTLTKVSSLTATNPYELVTELKVQSMPVRSCAFHFAVEDAIPLVYAINDLTVRFTDSDGSFADSTLQYLDVNSKESITKTTLLEKDEPTTVLTPDEGKIKWFRLEAYRGDGIRLQASRPCTMHLFAPDGEEIYHVSGDAAKTIAGTNGLLTGIYYVALHDISDDSDNPEITVTYYPGASILTEKPEASLADNSEVYRGTTVSLNCATDKAVIWYTTDGSEPSLESETTHRFNGKAINIDGDMVIRSIATCNDMLVSDESIYHYFTHKTKLRWDFSKRWNWISHNMADDMPINELYDYAEYIQSEDQTLSIIRNLPAVGSMSSLTATASYKIKSKKDVVIERKLDMIDPAKAPIELHKGWNWIGYPVSHSQTLSEAFGNQARDGDVVSGQLGYAIYENGIWTGTLQTLDTGRGYLLMSKSNRVLTFRDQEDSATQPQQEPFSSGSGLKVDIYGYPTTMNVTGQLYVGGERVNAEDFAIGAFCDDECRGIAEPIDGIYYLTVYGNDDDVITLKAVKATTLEKFDVAETFNLTQEAYGSRVSPLRLNTDFPSVVTVTSVSREYGEPNPELTYTVEGSQLRGKPELKCETDTQSAVGEYDIIINKGSVENMNVTYVGGTLTVTKAPLTVSVGEYTREEYEDNPVFTILYEGFKNDETAEVLISEPVATTTATVSSPLGEYDIVVSGGEAQNYEFHYVNGKLMVVIGPNDIAEIMESGKFNVYTLDGLLVAKEVETLKGLAKGIYIVRSSNSRMQGNKGKKVVVK